MKNPSVGNGGLGSRPAQGALAQEPRQRQLSSAAPRVTAREEDKGQQGSASHRVPGLPVCQAKEMDRPSSPGLTSDKNLRDGFGKHDVFGSLKSARDLHDPLLPVPGLPLSQAKETDHPSSPGLTSDKDLRDGFGKIRAALCQLAEKNLEPEDVEIFENEMRKRREKNTSLQLPPQTVEPRDAAEASFGLPPVNGTAFSEQRKPPGNALKKVLMKQDKVPLLPSVPTTHEEGSVPCNSSVTSPAAPGAQRREELLRGHGHKDTACPDPQQALLQALSSLGSDDWEKKEKGLVSLKHLAGSHSEVLLSRRHDNCLAVTSEVRTLFWIVPCTSCTVCRVDMCLFISMCAQGLPSFLFLDFIFLMSVSCL
ncbi:PREDICTED: protein FAM179A-like [Ficedula albicollis]|uniref:protein FAM179A-like n=1 Tax=Ficedula albicollis TaxID=59894 RepID=UPI0007AD8E39|nr:PREDICTED: protein FAM179A-like [Ficedula albicollis]